MVHRHVDNNNQNNIIIIFQYFIVCDCDLRFTNCRHERVSTQNNCCLLWAHFGFSGTLGTRVFGTTFWFWGTLGTEYWLTLRQKNIYYLGCGWVSVKLSQNISGFWPKKWFQPKAEKISDYMVHTHGFVLLWFTIYFNIFFIFSFFKLCKQKREKGGGGRQKKTKRKTKRKTKNENENKNDVFNLLEFRGRLL